MSFRGSLKDVTVADVMQFVNLGARSGTLRLEHPQRGAESALCASIGFHRGRIISVHGAMVERLGDILLHKGAITEKALQTALAAQRGQTAPMPLGQILLDLGLVTRECLREAVEHRITQVVLAVVGWRSGQFEFLPDALQPIDDLVLSPDDILSEIHVNTQMLLLEATRLFDERSRRPSLHAAPAEPAPLSPAQLAGTSGATSRRDATRPRDASPTLPGAGPTTGPTVATDPGSSAVGAPALRAVPAAPAPTVRLQLVSSDVVFAGTLESLAARHGASLSVVAPGAPLAPEPGVPSAILVVDLRAGLDPAGLAALEQSRRRAMSVAILASPAHAAAAYQAGALTVVSADGPLLEPCLANLIKHRHQQTQEVGARDAARTDLARLNKIFGEFRSGLVTATVSLNLMSLVSESVERGLLFLVGRDDLLVLAAFGATRDRRSLARRARGLRVKLGTAGSLSEALRDGRPRSSTFSDANLPTPLAELLGPPLTDSCAIFPLLGSRSVVAAVYADNGQSGELACDMQFLELATSQVGMLYENELLRRRLDRPSAERPAAQTSGGQTR